MKKFIIDQNHDNPIARAEEAIDIVEGMGTGVVVLFIGSPNLPGRLPETVWRSNAMWRFEDGKWYEYSIFSGVSERLGEAKPH